jgi:hypothetical protein
MRAIWFHTKPLEECRGLGTIMVDATISTVSTRTRLPSPAVGSPADSRGNSSPWRHS